MVKLSGIFEWGVLVATFKQIILVITNSRGASQAFVTDDFQYLLLKEAIALMKRGVLKGVHLVNGLSGTYIRSNNNNAKEDNLVSLSVPAGSLSKQIKLPEENERVSLYADAYGKFLEKKFKRDELVYLSGLARIPKKDVINRLRPLLNVINLAAEKYEVDPNLLAAILIDEIARVGPDDLLDVLGKMDIVDTTVGLAQIRMSTARDLIKKRYYSADPNISQSELYDLLLDDKVSVQFAAAYLSFIEKLRERRNLGTSAAEVASCYSRGKFSDQANSRGKQIATNLRRYAREIRN